MRISDWSSDVCSSDLFDALDYQGVFTPPSLKGTLEYPGLGGGINWGSVSVDPVHRRMIVNLQTAPFTIKLVPRAQYKGAMNGGDLVAVGPQERSEEHTSELQSLMRISYAVFCLKKKTIHKTRYSHTPARQH